MLDILEESHLIKLLDNKEYVVNVFEEIIEFNKTQNTVENYFSIVEQAKQDLKSTVQIWTDDKQAFEKVEFFTNEKLFYFIFKTCKAIEYLHSQNVYYGDMKEANILVFRDYSVKLGDFGISIKLDPKIDWDEE